MNWFSVVPVAANTWHISERIGAVEPRYGVATVNMFVVAGREQVALIDSGMGIGDLRGAVSALTGLPVLVCNTHWHWDHSGSNAAFDQIAIHESEARLLERGQDMNELRAQLRRPELQASLPAGFDAATYRVYPSQATRELQDGEQIELGGRTLRVIHTPGHSFGHVAYFEEAGGILFSGDMAYQGPMYACFKGSDPEAFQASAHQLAAMRKQVKCIYPGHNDLIEGGAFLADLASAADRAVNGDTAARPPDDFIGGRQVPFGSFSIWLPKEPSA
jgi:glyoxylase-like metal-dependent hydrolase (beta-lactamase superfamily II)